MILRLAALAILLAATTAFAKPTAPPAPDEIVIEAPQIELAKRAVAIFTQPPHGEQIARWREPLRIHVYYAPPPASDFIRTRISEVAGQVGLKTISVERQPNVAIVFTGSASEFTRKLLKAHPALYRDTDQTNFPTKREVAALMQDRPIRWFEVRQERAGDDSTDFSTSKVATSYGGASRITETSLYRKYMTYIIIDTALVRTIDWQQLADYLAMIVLTEPGLDDAHVGENTILSIFTPDRPDRPEQITALDEAVLKAYYGYTENLRFSVQRAEIERSVAKTLQQSK